MQQQQPPPPPHAGMPGSLPGNFPLASITTEQIQKYLDENKQLILAILDNQNLGKLAECAQYQAQLQKNLLYLAAIADAQPQIPAIRAPTLPHPAMQAAMAGPLPFMQQQLPVFAPRPPSAAVAFHQAQQMQMAQHQFHRPQQLAAAGIDNGDISAGSSDAFRRSSGEERGGAAGSRDTTTPAPAPSSSSLQKA